MRLSAVIIGISFAVVCTSLATTQQAEPTAEQQFKNIVSFKGKKASDVIPAMRFMDASLNVQCSYCHVEDRASDEVEKKKTAREMIALQKDINDKNFEGRTVVTCATCHAGHTHPISVPPMTGLGIRTKRSTDVAADQVLGAYAKALGGDAASAVAGFVVKGNVTAKGETVPFEATYSGDKFTIVSHAPSGDRKQGFNGTLVWFGTPTGTQKVPLAYAISFVRESALILNGDALPKLSNPTGGTAKIDGKDLTVVSGTITADGSRASYYFDKETGLLARTTYSYPTVLGSMQQINDYSDYKKIAGIQIPMKITNRAPEGDTIQELSFASVAPKLDPIVFEPPAK
jgi:hypothetical protein